MSAIYGLLHTDGAPVEPQHLAAMGAVLAPCGPQGGEAWHVGAVGLGTRLLANTPEARRERQPLQDATRTFTLVAAARLDNRAELAGAVGIPLVALAEQPDSALILRAYEKWGEDAPAHLVGDWAYALWDARERKLLLARDQCGISALHYWQDGHTLAFATTIPGLLALPMIPARPNMLYVARTLTSWANHHHTTAYEGILRLGPGQCLTVRAANATPRRYWKMEAVTPVRLASDEAYVETFRDLFTTAVRDRLRSDRPICVTLSGGLDSSSVTATAAPLLAAQGQRLTAYTSVPLYESKGYAAANRFVDEAPYAAATREWVGNLDGCLIDAREVSPIQGVRRYLEVLDEPGHAAGNAFWLMALQERAQRDGFGTLLTGQGGNATISWTGNTTVGLWPLIRQQGWGQVMDALRRDVASGRDPTLRRAFRRELLWPIYYPLLAWRDRLHHLGRPDWDDYAAINPRFAATLRLRQMMREDGHDPAFSPPRDPLHHRLLILQPSYSILGALWAVQAGAFGLEMRDPTLDQRVVSYCLGLPDEQFHHEGQDRWLIRRAMEGRLPPQVLWNTQRGLQAADVGRRTLDHAAEMEETLAALERSPLARETLDLVKMRRVWRALQERVDRTSSTQCGTILLRGIMVGLFLLRFEGGAV